jgi:hypothetical protein
LIEFKNTKTGLSKEQHLTVVLSVAQLELDPNLDLLPGFMENQEPWQDSIEGLCAADFSLLNLPKGKSLGRSKPATNSYAQAPQHTVWKTPTISKPYCLEIK